MLVGLTGANGFLGKHILDKALDDGHEIIAFVRSKDKLKEYELNDQIVIVEETYKDSASLSENIQQVIRKHGQFDMFIHNAGLTKSLKKETFFKINLDLTSLVCEALQVAKGLKKTGRIVYISSLAAEGPANIGKPVSAYGESKLAAEAVIKSSGFDYHIFRPTGIYGSGDLAFLPMFKSAKKGFHFDLSQKNQKLTLVLANDLAKEIIRADSMKKNTIIPISDGHQYTQQDLAFIFQEIFGRKVRYIRISPNIAKAVLSISDFIHGLFNKTPEVTVEKYAEISQDWNNSSLNQIEREDDKFISLKEGFSLTLQAYRQNSLI